MCRINKQFSAITNMSDWIKRNEAIDVFYAQQIIPCAEAYILKEHLFTQRSEKSDIEKCYVDYNEMLQSKQEFWNAVLEKNPS